MCKPCEARADAEAAVCSSVTYARRPRANRTATEDFVLVLPRPAYFQLSTVDATYRTRIEHTSHDDHRLVCSHHDRAIISVRSHHNRRGGCTAELDRAAWHLWTCSPKVLTVTPRRQRASSTGLEYRAWPVWDAMTPR